MLETSLLIYLVFYVIRTRTLSAGMHRTKIYYSPTGRYLLQLSTHTYTYLTADKNCQVLCWELVLGIPTGRITRSSQLSVNHSKPLLIGNTSTHHRDIAELGNRCKASTRTFSLPAADYQWTPSHFSAATCCHYTLPGHGSRMSAEHWPIACGHRLGSKYAGSKLGWKVVHKL